MGRADAVDVRGTIGNGEITGIDHAQINVECFPELPGAPCAGLSTPSASFISPPSLDALAAFDILASIFAQAADLGLEPGIEDRHAHRLQELAHSIAPAELFFRRSRRDKIHRARQVHARTLQQASLPL